MRVILLHVVGRFRRVSADRIVYQFTPRRAGGG